MKTIQDVLKEMTCGAVAFLDEPAHSTIRKWAAEIGDAMKRAAPLTPESDIIDVPEFLRQPNPAPPATTPAAALDILRAAFRKDPSYAWSWHCNIACAFVDEGGDHSIANHAAHRFMQLAFGIKEPAHPLPEKYPDWLGPMDDDIRIDKLRITGSDDAKWLIAQLDAKRDRLAEFYAIEYGKADAPKRETVTPSGLSIAAIGCEHFGNPIPQAWYSAAKALLAAANPPAAPERKP